MPSGGKRAGAGRPKGSRNASTLERFATLSELAKDHASGALAALVHIATKGESEAARVTAANSILDRAYGKPVQGLEHTSPDGTMTPKPGLDVSGLSSEALAEILAASDAAQSG